MARKRQQPVVPSPLGELIQRYRGRRGLIRSELAARLQVDPATVGRWEDEATLPSGRTALRLWRVLRFEPPDDDLFMQLTGLTGEDVAAGTSTSATPEILGTDSSASDTALVEVAHHLESLRRLVYLGAHVYAADEAKRLASTLRPAAQAALRSRQADKQVVRLTVQALHQQGAALRDSLPSRELRRALRPIAEAIELATAARLFQPDQMAGLLDEQALIKRMLGEFEAAKENFIDAREWAEAPGMRRQVYINEAMLTLDDPATGDFEHLLQLGGDQVKGPGIGEEQFIRSRTAVVWARGITRMGDAPAELDRALRYISDSRATVDPRRELDQIRLDKDEAALRLKRTGEAQLGLCLAVHAWERAGAACYPFQQEGIERLLAPYGGFAQLRADHARLCTLCSQTDRR